MSLFTGMVKYDAACRALADAKTVDATAVYFIRAGETGPVKIGVAVNVSIRLASLQTANHEELFLLRSLSGTQQTEQWLHNHYANIRIRGEWFSYCDTMRTIAPPEFRSGRMRRKIGLSTNSFLRMVEAEGVSNV